VNDGSIYRGQTADVILEQDTTELLVGALQDAEASFNTEKSTLMGDGNKILDKQITKVSFDLTASYGSFDVEALMSIMNYSKSKEGIKDSPEVPTFKVLLKLDEKDGNVKYLELQEVDLEVSISWSRDEFVTTDIEGEGRDVRFLDENKDPIS